MTELSNFQKLVITVSLCALIIGSSLLVNVASSKKYHVDTNRTFNICYNEPIRIQNRPLLWARFCTNDSWLTLHIEAEESEKIEQEVVDTIAFMSTCIIDAKECRKVYHVSLLNSEECVFQAVHLQVALCFDSDQLLKSGLIGGARVASNELSLFYGALLRSLQWKR